MARDKKARNGRVPLILARGIGKAFVDDAVTLDEIADFLDRQRQKALVAT
jgi:3-dehydroquinate synthase